MEALVFAEEGFSCHINSGNNPALLHTPIGTPLSILIRATVKVYHNIKGHQDLGCVRALGILGLISSQYVSIRHIRNPMVEFCPHAALSSSNMNCLSSLHGHHCRATLTVDSCNIPASVCLRCLMNVLYPNLLSSSVVRQHSFHSRIVAIGVVCYRILVRVQCVIVFARTCVLRSTSISVFQLSSVFRIYVQKAWAYS